MTKRKRMDSTPRAGGRGLPSREDVAGLSREEAARIRPGRVSRRTVMKLAAASTLLSMGAPGCKRKPFRKIVSMADSPEYQHPGETLFYASTWTEGQVPYGMMIKTVDGRPVKIEGLPNHPLNRGASSAAMQASILSLYDPDRLRFPVTKGIKTTWKDVDGAVAAALEAARSVALVTRASLGPSERSMIGEFLKAYPSAKHFIHETVHDEPRRRAWREIFGTDGELLPRLSKARIILSLDCDFLGTDGAVLENVREFAETRAVNTESPADTRLSRLYVAESSMTLTGTNGDLRIPLRPSAMLDLVRALRSALAEDFNALKKVAGHHHLNEKILGALLKDLKAHVGASVVLAGSHLPESVHAQVALLNREIGAFGKTLEWNPEPCTLAKSPPGELEAFLKNGVDLLLLMGVNPVHDWPGGGFETLLAKAGLSVGHGLYLDETLAACTYALPSCHNLETWNDASPRSGLHSICQPVIAPLFDSRPEGESLLKWTLAKLGETSDLARCKDWHGYVQRTYNTRIRSRVSTSGNTWEDLLRKGFMEYEPSGQAPGIPALRQEAAERLAGKGQPGPGPIELVIHPHHALFDGRFGNNGWLQEFPDPMTKQVWGNAALISPATARELNLEEGDWVEIKAGPGSLGLPVLIQPGTARGVVTVTLGHGRFQKDGISKGSGMNGAALMGGAGSEAPRLNTRVEITRLPGEPPGQVTEGNLDPVKTQKAFSMMGRPLVLHGTREEYGKDPAFVKKHLHAVEKVQLHDEYDYSQTHKWVMAIDLSRCTGCGICVIACQAENNIPAVGKEECAKGREMHWIRLDRYYGKDEENPRAYHQPMLCQHCDNAPCESVCPVNATSHNIEGLNEQTYNRCVGTRYCANNCPYKVRRFNFFNYQGRILKDPVQELGFNPQVTVRSRGVMEKCTFCVQRINEKKFHLKNQGLEVPDGAVQPACLQACPAGAIVFGDLNAPGSRVAELRGSSLAYFVLDELNVRPNVSYLARVRNPHPDLESPEDPGGHE